MYHGLYSSFQPKIHTDTFVEIPLRPELSPNIKIKNNLDSKMHQIKEIVSMVNLSSSFEEMPKNMKLMYRIIQHIPAEEKFDFSPTSSKTRLTVISIIAATALLGFVIGAGLGSIINNEFGEEAPILIYAFLSATLMSSVIAFPAACVCSPPNCANTMRPYETVIKNMNREMIPLALIKNAISSNSEKQLCENLDNILSTTSVSIETAIRLINSILQTIHPNSSVCQKWKNMSSQVEAFLDNDSIEEKNSHKALASLVPAVENVGIERLSQFYKSANLNNFKLLSKTKLELSLSFEKEFSKLLSLIDNNYYYPPPIADEIFEKKLLQLEKKALKNQLSQAELDSVV